MMKIINGSQSEVKDYNYKNVDSFCKQHCSTIPKELDNGVSSNDYANAERILESIKDFN